MSLERPQLQRYTGLVINIMPACFHHVVEGREALFDRRGDGAQDEYHRQVHPAHQTTPQHSRLLVKARDVAGHAVERFVWPRNREELLPPSGGDIRDIETEDEGERDEI